MKRFVNFIAILLLISILSCTKKDKVSVITEKNIETQMIEAFEEGYDD